MGSSRRSRASLSVRRKAPSGQIWALISWTPQCEYRSCIPTILINNTCGCSTSLAFPTPTLDTIGAQVLTPDVSDGLSPWASGAGSINSDHPLDHSIEIGDDSQQTRVWPEELYSTSVSLLSLDRHSNLLQRTSRRSLPCASSVDQGVILPYQTVMMISSDGSGTRFVDPAERMIRMQGAGMRHSTTRRRLTRSRRYWSSSIVRILPDTLYLYHTDVRL